MDQDRFLNACRLRDQGELDQAYREFSKLSEEIDEPWDKAMALLYAAKTLKLAERYDEATKQLSAARAVATDVVSGNSLIDERVAYVEVYLDFEDADLSWKLGQNLEALGKFDAMRGNHLTTLRKPEFRGVRESIEACRAFILVDLGRCGEALPVLEAAGSFTEYREGIAYYLGHCYLLGHEHQKAEEKLAEALRLGLPHNLEYRAHFELGVAFFELRNYAAAKRQFEKSAGMANSRYLKDAEIWKWLESTCLSLGLKTEARNYANLARPS
jgi:tetratricopeptide (TPR) repeat protein